MNLRAFVSLYHRIPRAAVSDVARAHADGNMMMRRDDDAGLFSECLESQRAPTACGTRASVCVYVCVTSLLLPFNSIITKHPAPPVEREKVQVHQVSTAKMKVQFVIQAHQFIVKKERKKEIV